MTIEQARRLPTVLTVAQAGELLGVQRARAYELAQDGTIPVIRLGHAMRVPTAKLLQLLGIDLKGDHDGPP
jgi:excisionase family DNA binding protein